MTVQIKHLGLVDYEPTWRAMQAANKSRTAETPDELWLVEHPPVFTLGLAGKPEHVLAPGDIPVVKIDRGGQVTYHGPGQLVIYLLLDLKKTGYGVKELVKRIEQSVIDLLAEYGITAFRLAGMPGVYVSSPSLQPLSHQGGEAIGSTQPEPQKLALSNVSYDALNRLASLPPRGGGSEGEGARADAAKIAAIGLPEMNYSTSAKIAAVGLRVANHATYHGLSLNIDMDLEPFSRINPCGYQGLAVTQMRELGVTDKMPVIGEKLVSHLKSNLYSMSS